MKRDPHMERRMLNWVRWREGACSIGLGYGSASIWTRIKVDGQGYREAVIPTDAVEAEQTDRAVEALPAYLRATMHVYYLSDEPMERKALSLSCGVSTVHSRVADAHRRIAAWFADKQRADADYRDRQEAAQRAAREVRMGAALNVTLPPIPSKRARKN